MTHKELTIAYGSGSLTCRLPAGRLIPYEIESEAKPLDRIEERVTQGLRAPHAGPPLDQLYRRGMKVCILCDDYTRPTPAYRLIPPLLDELRRLGLGPDEVKILIAAGFHREMTPAEKRKKFGQALCDEVQLVHHEAEDYDNLVDLGLTETGVPLSINRLAAESDLLIGVGVIEIHPWAGFAGGHKILSPGVAGKRTINYTHSLPVTQDGVEIGETLSNPFWRSSREAGEKAGLALIINPVLDEAENITGLFIGEPTQTQLAGVDYFKSVNEWLFAERVDIAITSSNPKFQYFGQSIIAAYNASRIVKPGGIRIVAGACPEGWGDSERETRFYHDSARRSWASLDEYWQQSRGDGNDNSRNACAFHRHLRELQKSRLIFVTDGISASIELPSLCVRDNLESAVEEALREKGNDATIAVVDKAGMVLPTAKSS